MPRSGPPRRLVLASASPARLRLLQGAGFDPEVIVSGVDEQGFDAPDLPALVRSLAEVKAGAVAGRPEAAGAVVVGCDSLLDVEGEAHGKPAGEAEARARLQRLRGRSAILRTGHCVIDTTTGRRSSGAAATEVVFGAFTDAELDAYLATGEPLHVAGAFTLDGRSAPFIERIIGDHGNVIGLSLPLFRTLLAEVGLTVMDLGRDPAFFRNGRVLQMNAGPLTIGPLRLDPPVVLAPMAGVTTRAFRRLCRRFGPGGLYVSEMLTSRALVEGNERTARMLRFDADERPRSAQLYGVAPGTVGEATRRLIGDFGVEHVDLNFGCPAPKVTAKGGGAALPVRRVLLADVIGAAVKAATPDGVPVTVKFRRGIDDGLLTAVSTGLIAEGEGAAAVALHARTAEQRYAGDASWAAIAELKAAVTTIPVLGNGDIWEAGDALRMMDETGCDGVVIGRGCLGRPWLFADLGAVFAGGQAAPPPTFGTVAGVMLQHAELLAEDEGETTGLCTFRRHAAWYTQGYALGADARRALGTVSSIAELAAILGSVDPDLALPLEALRWKRGHTDGPRPVRLPDGWLTLVDDPTPPAGAEILISGG